MIDQGLLKKQFVGRDGFFWWIGQVVASKSWIDNVPPLPVLQDDLPGLKSRVKVRILGYHTADTEILTDDDLPWAYCMMPVTAGGAGGGMSQSVNFSGGEFVFGFFLDGEDGQQPIVMGVLDKSSQLTFPNEIPKLGFSPFQGYTNGEVVSMNNLLEGGAPGKTDPNATPVESQNGVKVKPQVSDSSSVNETDQSFVKNWGDDTAFNNLKNTGEVKIANKCADDNPGEGIKLAISRLQKQTKFLEEQQGIYLDKANLRIGDIQKETERASENVSAYMKDIMDKVRGVMLKETAEAAAKASVELPIDKMNEFKDKLDDQLEGLGCGFENIVGGLNNTMNGLLGDMMGKVTGSLDCVVNDVVGNMIDSALSEMNATKNSLNGIMDSLTGVTGSVKLPLTEAADFLGSMKRAFSCEAETECADIAQVNALSGNQAEAPSDFIGLVGGALTGGMGSMIPEPVGGILNAASDLRDSIDSVSDSVGALVNNVEAAGQTIGNAIERVSDIPGQALENLQSCNPFADTCEPALAVIFGGGTVETTANAIINKAGHIIGVDLNGSEVINRFYSGTPSVNFRNNCGQGDGASGRAVMADDGGTVIKIVMDSPGVNYPSVSDGSVGGSGYTFAAADQTIIRTEDGDQIAVDPDREVTFPANSVVFVPMGGSATFPVGTVDQQGNDASGFQDGRGLTDGNGFEVAEETTINTPNPGPQPDPDTDLVYPVIMELDEINVNKTGISYNDGDTITVSGGGLLGTLTLTPKLSISGSIIAVDIPENQRGQGFTDIPTITINSPTGAGADLTPYLRVKYRGKDVVDEVLEQVTQDQVISVIDCVGNL